VTSAERAESIVFVLGGNDVTESCRLVVQTARMQYPLSGPGYWCAAMEEMRAAVCGAIAAQIDAAVRAERAEITKRLWARAAVLAGAGNRPMTGAAYGFAAETLAEMAVWIQERNETTAAPSAAEGA
jgi:hypothetical protein